MNNKKIVYIADLNNNVDDIIAIDYLNSLGLLKEVVLDPMPKGYVGMQRYKILNSLKVNISTYLPKHNEVVINTSGFEALSKAIKDGCIIGTLISKGGFVGSNVITIDKQQKAFKFQEVLKVTNFNTNVDDVDCILKTTDKQIYKIVLFGENVTSDERNTKEVLWRNNNYVDKYTVSELQKLKSLLICREALVLCGLGDVSVPWCTYEIVKPYNKGLCGVNTKWGSSLVNRTNSPYREVIAAINIIKIKR